MEKITVILAIYNPNIVWLNSLLVSLNNQTFKDFKIDIIDDCSTTIIERDILNILKTNLTKVKYKFKRNKANIGSNKTFENLIINSDTKYIALCDQDDVWHIDKLSKTYEAINKYKVDLICSDVNVINEKGDLVFDSITKYNKGIKLVKHKNALNYLLYHNFVIGCTALIKRDIAIKSLPFFDSMYHDQQLAICALNNNSLKILHEQLLDYRIHQKNQTCTFKNIVTKNDYYINHILRDELRFKELSKKYDFHELELARLFTKERIKNYLKKKNSLKKYKKLDIKTYYFEKYILKSDFLFKLFKKINKLYY